MTRWIDHWPVLLGAAVCLVMVLASATDDLDLEWKWLSGGLSVEQPPEPAPRVRHAIPFAPSPLRDDRTPLAYLDWVFGLDDPDAATDLNGVGRMFWFERNEATGALIAPNVVLTTAHVFAEDGLWKADGELSPERPEARNGRIYLEACGRSYRFAHIRLGDIAPRVPTLGLDFALAVLEAPACPEASILPVAIPPHDLVDHADQILLALGSYPIADITAYADHPIFAGRAGRDMSFSAFGVRCAATGIRPTGEVAEGATSLIATEGCDGVPGGSGGPLVLSRDGGKTYNIVGISNSYSPDTEFNSWTRVHGAVAAQLRAFVEVHDLSGEPDPLNSNPIP
ncbi:MAG: hypothetical protein AAFQ05_01030 [Pseudomonadota bacterium]